LLKLSLDDARSLFGTDIAAAALDRLASYHAPHLVLTDGARGAWFAQTDHATQSADRFVPAFSVDAVDPTGAGDAFTAAIIARLLRRNWTRLDRADVVFAAAAGGMTPTRRGAIYALPTTAEIAAFLEDREKGGETTAPHT